MMTYVEGLTFIMVGGKPFLPQHQTSEKDEKGMDSNKTTHQTRECLVSPTLGSCSMSRGLGAQF